MHTFLRLLFGAVFATSLWSAPAPASNESVIVKEVMQAVKEEYHRVLSTKELADLKRLCIIVAQRDPSMRECMKRLDPHTDYLTPKDWDQFTERMRRQPFGGIGVTIKKNDGNPPCIHVVAPISGGPSERSGVRAGDVITEIEGKNENGVAVMLPTANMELEQVIKLLKGEVRTSVRITIMREGNAGPIFITIVRELIQVPLVSKKELKRTTKGVFGLVALDQFGEDSAKEVREAILELKRQNNGPLDGYILDFRNNPGGRLAEADKINDLFMLRALYPNDDAAVTLQIERRGERKPVMFVGGAVDITDSAPNVILINGRSASASELVAGILRKHGRAIVAGVERSYGKGTVQIFQPLPHGGAIHITISQYLIGSIGCASTVQGIGINPDILLKRQTGEKPVTQYEENYARSIAPSNVSDVNCKYRRKVPAAHWSVAHDMLRAFNLEPITAQQP